MVEGWTLNSDKLRFREHATKSASRAGAFGVQLKGADPDTAPDSDGNSGAPISDPARF